MEQVALHTRLRPDKEQEYQRVHTITFPAGPDEAELPEVEDDHSGDDHGLDLVWRLP